MRKKKGYGVRGEEKWRRGERRDSGGQMEEQERKFRESIRSIRNWKCPGDARF